MPETEFQQALRDAIEEVLEKMFFVEPLQDPCHDFDPAASGDWRVKLTFDGSPSGALTLRVTEAAARQIAADFLGADGDSLSSSQIGEVVCELANMICGSVLSRVEPTATFRLAQPRLLPVEEWQHPPAADCRAIHAVRIGSGSLTATVETRDPVCPAVQKSVS